MVHRIVERRVSDVDQNVVTNSGKGEFSPVVCRVDHVRQPYAIEVEATANTLSANARSCGFIARSFTFYKEAAAIPATTAGTKPKGPVIIKVPPATNTPASVLGAPSLLSIPESSLPISITHPEGPSAI